MIRWLHYNRFKIMGIIQLMETIMIFLTFAYIIYRFPYKAPPHCPNSSLCDWNH